MHDPINDYTPQFNATRWHAIEDYVRDTANRALDRDTHTPRELANTVRAIARHVDWCVHQTGRPMRDDVIFDAQAINDSCELGHEELTQSSRGNIRVALRKVARNLGVDTQPIAPTIHGHEDPCAPYTQTEVHRIREWTRDHSTALRRRNAQFIVALGLGAGLKSSEIAGVKGEDITVDGEGVLVWVRDRGLKRHTAERAVPVALDLEGILVRNLKDIDAGEWLVAPDRNTASRAMAVTDFCWNYSGQVYVTAQRLRATWIYRHLAAGSPVNAVVHAAGLSSLRMLERTAVYLPDGDRAEARYRLRHATLGLGE